MRCLAVCVAVSFGGQATGALELLSPPCCADPCPADNDEGRCPPACATCAFAKVFGARLWPAIGEPLALADALRPLPLVAGGPPDGVHDDVFHPPRG